MVKTNTTISIDSDIREKVKKIMKSKGLSFSFYVEQCARKLIEDSKKQQGENNG